MSVSDIILGSRKIGVGSPKFQLLNGAMAWMMKCFGRSLTLQELMVGLRSGYAST